MTAHHLPLLAPTAPVRLLHAAILLWPPAQLLAFQPPRQACTHQGPLVLRGTEVYTIENATFIQCGPAEVCDQGQLVIRDSTVEFRQHYHHELPGQFHGSAQLVVERSPVGARYGYTVFCSARCNPRVDSSTLVRAGIGPIDTATVSIVNSTVGGGELRRFGADQPRTDRQGRSRGFPPTSRAGHGFHSRASRPST